MIEIVLVQLTRQIVQPAQHSCELHQQTVVN